jgi:hypothetical protein
MDEQENRPTHWLRGNAVSRKVLAAQDRLVGAYYRHVDRYHQANQGVYRFCARAVSLILVLLTLTATYLTVRPYYRHYQETRGARRAEAFLVGGDYRNALISARQALLLNPSNVPACRVMAELADSHRSPLVLEWRQRIVQAEPTDENKLLLAAAGLRYQRPPYPLTTGILAGLPATATNNAAYQLIAASVALGSHHLAEAESHFAAAAQLDPTNQLRVLNLAILRLGMTNEAERVLSRVTLEDLSTNADLGPAALRALVSDRLANNDLAAADQYSTRLIAFPQASLADQLQGLGISRQLTNSDFFPRLRALQEQTATNAAAVAEVSSWMQGHGLVAENLRWLTSLPESLRAGQPVELALANGYLLSGDWRSLRDFASQGNWKSLEFLRFALVSHACAQMGMPSVAGGNWNAAVNEADSSYQATVRLVELAANWHLQREQEELLQQIMQRYPKEHWVPESLTQLYFSEGKTAALNELSDRLTLLFPTDTVFKNNLAATALLLKTNLPQAFQWAADAYTNSPGDPNEATTYAYALHLQGRDQDGLALLEKFPPTRLKEPTLALYYGILLAATGKHEEAAAWLQIAQTNGNLLPEEKQLLLSASEK